MKAKCKKTLKISMISFSIACIVMIAMMTYLLINYNEFESKPGSFPVYGHIIFLVAILLVCGIAVIVDAIAFVKLNKAKKVYELEKIIKVVHFLGGPVVAIQMKQLTDKDLKEQ